MQFPVLGPNNPRIRTLRRLASQRRERRSQGVALLEGPTLVAEALAEPMLAARVQEIYTEVALDRTVQANADATGIPVSFVEPGALARVLDTVSPQPVLAVVEVAANSIDDLAPDRPVLVLVDVRDPGNLGTLIRAAEASGCAGLVLSGSCVDPTNPKVIRASAGSWLRTVVVEHDDPFETVDMLAAQGRRVFGAAIGPDAVSLWDADLEASAILLGNEAHGLPELLVERADATLMIPFDGPTESLNVGVAGALIAFEALRRRRMV